MMRLHTGNYTISMAKKTYSILIVEDEPNLKEAYQIILRKEGFKVHTANNGKEALKATDQFSPDLILLDLRMPDMDGNEFLRAYDLDKHPGVKVVVFSNYDTQNEIDEAYKRGVDHYILKALASPKELVKIIRDTLAE